MKYRKDLENSKTVFSISSDLQGGHHLDFSDQQREVQGRHGKSENGESCIGGA